MQSRGSRFSMKHGIIVGTLLGEPLEGQLRECQQRLISLVNKTGSKRVLYDARRMAVPSLDVVLAQRTLEDEANPLKLRRAIVVASTRAGYLAGLAFGQGDYRIFYEDTEAAISWLAQDGRTGTVH